MKNNKQGGQIPLIKNKKTPADSEPFRRYLGPLFLLMSLFFLNFGGRVVPAPLAPVIEKDLGLTHAEAGSLFLLVYVGYFITLISSGLLSSRITHRQTIILSTIALGIALLVTPLSTGVWSLRLCLWLVGVAGGFYLPSAISTLTDIVPVRHWGKAIAIHELAPTLGFILTPLISEIVIYWFSWRSVFLFLGFFGLLQALVFRRFGRGGSFLGEPPKPKTLRSLFVMPSYWLMIILFSLGVSGTLGTFTMLPLYLVTEHAMERSWANTLISLSRLSSVAMALIGGWFSDRFGPRRTMMIVFLVTGALTMLLGSASRSWIAVIVFLQPLTAVCFFPAGFAALSQITSSEVRHIAVAFTTPFAVLVGGGLIPTLIGFVGDVHSFALGIALLGGFIMAGAAFAPFLRFRSAPQQVPMPHGR